jgi:DNA-binding response OmpR family regulator
MTDTATMKKAWEHGCARYLVKPVHSEFLCEQVRAVLSHRAPAVKDPSE